MALKYIVAALSSVDIGLSTLTTAAELAKKHGAHIDVVHVRPDPKGLVPYTGEGMDGSMIEEIMEVTEREGGDRAEKARTMFDKFVADGGYKIADTPSGDGMSLSWVEETGREDEIIAVRGRIADLVVVGRPMRDAPLPSPVTLEAALMDTGRPMLVAPPTPPTVLGKHIAVAWEGSTEAARALSAATPILEQAEQVTIMTATHGSTVMIGPEELARALSWHGVTATPHNYDPAGREIGASLLDEANKVGADMMIKGAYSTSRLRQMILGGRTRHILFNTEIPVLLAH